MAHYQTYLTQAQPTSDIQQRLQDDFTSTLNKNIDYTEIKLSMKDIFAMNMSDFRSKIMTYTVKPNWCICQVQYNTQQYSSRLFIKIVNKSIQIVIYW